MRILLRAPAFWFLLWLPLCSGAELTIEAIFTEPGLTGPAPEQLRWSPDGRQLSYILEREEGGGRDLWALHAASGAKRILVSSERLDELAPEPEQATGDERERERRRRYAVPSYLWSPDSQSLLFTSAGQLHLYDLAAGRARAVAPEKKNVRDPKFSPNGRWISFVSGHDLWLAPASGGEEQRLTAGGSSVVLHGELDWVYPEEFGIRSGYEWSPDSSRIAFLEIDQRDVPTYPITTLTKFIASTDFQRYPKAGDPNPRVRLGVVEARPGGEFPPVGWIEHEGEYVPRFTWVNSTTVAMQVLNRAQTELELIAVEAERGLRRTLLKESDRHWINVADDLRFLAKQQQFLWTSERSGFRHIYLYEAGGELARALTSGEWEVKKIEAVDEDAGWVYFSSNERNPLGSDLYRMRLDGSGKERLTQQQGTHAINFNPQAAAYADQHSALMRPPRVEVDHLPSGKRTLLHRARGLAEYELNKPELIEQETPDGALVRMLLLKPEGREEARRPPLVAYVYGGPRAPTIRDAWDTRGRFLFHQYLAKKGYMVAQIDDRASARLGHRYETALSRDYGPVALKDYLFAIDRILELGGGDPERVAIWGWSGGGFSACYALTHSDRFRVGVAVAPVTDWRLYDSIYTERYMGQPAQEAEAYRRTSAVEAAADLHGHLLLAHGTADDNVHWQHTVAMIDALVEGGKPYDLLIYPDKTHGIYGGQARIHLFRSIERYLEKNL